MTPSNKERIDKLLFEKGFASSREKAKAIIMAGQVVVNDKRIDKAGEMVPADGSIRIKGETCPYVGRGGLKLEKALDHFAIEVAGKVAIDVGASTGGFTDCLLKQGIEKVYAIDVGYGQMDLKVRNNPRVVCIERTNIRELPAGLIPEQADLAVIDVSFISLTKVIPHVLPLLKEKAEIIALVKPQFEVGKGEVGKGGIVREEKKRLKAVEEVTRFCTSEGLRDEGVIESPITGAGGNVEYLLYLSK